jgi:DNA polymerase-3 subunit beta
MKVTIARGALLEALSAASRGLSSRTTLPILSGIHITAAGSSLTLQATDLEVSIKTACEARVDESGVTVVPGKILTDIVRSLPDAAVTIEATTTGSASVSCGQSAFSLKTLAADDYPKFPDVTPAEAIELPTSTFTTMVHQVAKAVSRDETRPILTGVLMVTEPGTLRMAATDSYRLCVRELPVPGLLTEMEVVVPGKALEDASKLAAAVETFTFGVSENQVIFTFGQTTFISRRIEGTFPNYKQLIPKEHTTRIVIDRNELFEAVKRVSVMVQHNTPLRLKADIATHTLTLSASTQGLGDAAEDIQVTPEGEDVEIAFNHGYLVDGVAVMDCETVAIEVTSPLKPGVLKPSDDDDFIYLLMPVRLS